MVPAMTGKMMARRMLMKNERKVQTMKRRVMMIMVRVLNMSHGTMRALRSVMELAVTMKERMMLVEEREPSTIRITLWLSSIRSINDHTTLVTCN